MWKAEPRHFVTLLVLVTAATFASPQQSETLGSVKEKYLNKRVTLIGYVADNLAPVPVLMEWHTGRESSGRYNANMESYLPATYRKAATVIAIQLNGLEKQGKVNALGESISADETVDPYFDLVVRFDDGQVAMISASPSTISINVRLA